MRNAQGYLVITDPTKTVECDTFTCHHCNRVVIVPPKAAPDTVGGFCRMCMKMVCPLCVDKGCTPFEKQMEAEERRDRLLTAVGVTR